ncbi:MAG: anaerobic carbon-monoxide dehydrogenase catalytic subunit, partial [Paraclostridium sp.]
PRGICGADADTIVARNFARMVAAGSAAHSDHARDIAHTMALASPNGNYKIRDEKKLLDLAAEWGIATEDRDIYDIAHEVADVALMEFGKPHGTLRFLERAPKKRQEVWDEYKIKPRAIDREVVTIMHSTHIGCTSDVDSLLHMSMRTSLADGWGGSMIGTRFSDILFGTPVPRETEANLGVLEDNKVNIILHGHEPSLSEMVVLAAEDPEMVALAKEVGAEGINLAGMCCTANEVTMRHGVKMAGNFHQQELAVLTGAVEAVIVDVQCIFPALASLSDCYHTKFITTSPKAKITGATHIEFNEEEALESAKTIVKEAILNYKNRKAEKVFIPQGKSHATVGYSIEAILGQLDRVVNSQIDPAGTIKPLVDCLKSGVLRGAVGIVGCNNPKTVADEGHITVMKELIKNDIIVVATGCAAQAAAKHGLLSKDARRLAGKGLATVCELVDIPPVLHMGSCVDISRILEVVAACANHLDLDMCDLPVAGVAPEWMSEKAVAIACYVVSSGIDTFLGVMPPVGGSPKMVEKLTNTISEKVGAKFAVHENPQELATAIVENMEAKRIHFENILEAKSQKEVTAEA